MGSTTYEHCGDVFAMCNFASDLKCWLKWAIFTNEFSFSSLKSLIRYHIAVLDNMVRNAGQLPQPFWLGVFCGVSCGAAPCAARA